MKKINDDDGRATADSSDERDPEDLPSPLPKGGRRKGHEGGNAHGARGAAALPPLGVERPKGIVGRFLLGLAF